MVRISTVINYCTNDYRFLRLCIEEARKFSQQIIIPVCAHFFNGEEENRLLLNRSYREHPDVQFIEFEYGEPYGLYSALTPADEDWSHYWHSTARYVGFQFVEKCDYVLFLDVDEIVDADRFIQWIQTFRVAEFAALRFSSYFYFRSPEHRAVDQFPLNGLLVRKKAIGSSEMILDVFERMGLYEQIEGAKKSFILGLDQRPLVHHYSWVRTPEELQQKVRTWGHRFDRDWMALIEKELARPFEGVDRVHGFHYEKVAPLHNPLLPIPFKQEFKGKIDFSHVVKVNKKIVFDKAVHAML